MFGENMGYNHRFHPTAGDFYIGLLLRRSLIPAARDASIFTIIFIIIIILGGSRQRRLRAVAPVLPALFSLLLILDLPKIALTGDINGLLLASS